MEVENKDKIGSSNGKKCGMKLDKIFKRNRRGKIQKTRRIRVDDRTKHFLQESCDRI